MFLQTFEQVMQFGFQGKGAYNNQLIQVFVMRWLQASVSAVAFEEGRLIAEKQH